MGVGQGLQDCYNININVGQNTKDAGEKSTVDSKEKLSGRASWRR